MISGERHRLRRSKLSSHLVPSCNTVESFQSLSSSRGNLRRCGYSMPLPTVVHTPISFLQTARHDPPVEVQQPIIICRPSNFRPMTNHPKSEEKEIEAQRRKKSLQHHASRMEVGVSIFSPELILASTTVKKSSMVVKKPTEQITFLQYRSQQRRATRTTKLLEPSVLCQYAWQYVCRDATFASSH